MRLLDIIQDAVTHTQRTESENTMKETKNTETRNTFALRKERAQEVLEQFASIKTSKCEFSQVFNKDNNAVVQLSFSKTSNRVKDRVQIHVTTTQYAVYVGFDTNLDISAFTEYETVNRWNSKEHIFVFKTDETLLKFYNALNEQLSDTAKKDTETQTDTAKKDSAKKNETRAKKDSATQTDKKNTAKKKDTKHEKTAKKDTAKKDAVKTA